MSNATKIGNEVQEALQAHFPSGWDVDLLPSHDRTADFLVILRAPTGAETTLWAEAKSRVQPRDVPLLREQLARMGSARTPMVIAPYLSPRTRELLDEAGIAYADTSGTARIATGSIFVERVGERVHVKNEESGARASLRGRVTGRVVRILTDRFPPMKVREIAKAAHTNPGNVSRLLTLLDREHLVVRDKRGTITDVLWEPLVKLWAKDLAKERESFNFVEPHGAEYFVSKLRSSSEPYALTGAYAAAAIAPVARAAVVDVYASSVNRFQKALELRRADGFANVRVLAPFDDIVFEGTMERSDLRIACPSQVAADLLTSPTRSNEEFDGLIDWMRRHESEWRHA